MAQRSLSKATDRVQQTSERLSSGLRVNRASDDAAGLAVAMSLNTSSRVYTQGIRNINDGVSALAIAQGAIESLSNVTQRIQELAEQSANGTYSAAQRAALDNEAQQLSREYSRIVDTSSFNGVQLVDGSFTQVGIQCGFGNNERIELSVDTANLTDISNTGTFSAAVSYGRTSPQINEIITLDLNQDGILDMAAASTVGGSAAVFIGNGDGSFKAPVYYTAIGSAHEINSGDVNGDGKADLVLASNPFNGVGVLVGNGDGTFKAGTTYFTGASASGAAIGDFDGDGKGDIVASSFSDSKIYFLRGNGDGTFLAGVSYNAINGPNGVVVTDLNGDNKLDVLSEINNGTSKFGVFIGNGDGTFKAEVLYGSMSAVASQMSVGDVNNDGKIDAVVATTLGVAISLGNGDGTFKAIVSFATGDTQAVSAVDLNSDGNLDLLAGNSAGVISILFGNGNGTFKAQSTYLTASGIGVTGIATGDFNRDGGIDIAAGATKLNILNGDITTTQVAGLGTFSLLSQSSSRQALETAQTTRENLAVSLGKIGAQQSRLGKALNVLQINKEGYLAAHSRIMDADIAQESSELVKTGILQQAGAAVLAQANQQPALALQLIR